MGEGGRENVDARSMMVGLRTGLEIGQTRGRARVILCKTIEGVRKHDDRIKRPVKKIAPTNPTLPMAMHPVSQESHIRPRIEVLVGKSSTQSNVGYDRERLDNEVVYGQRI